MNEAQTALAALAALALALAFGWLGARPARPLAKPRLIPWRPLMLVAFTGLIALLVHLAALIKGR